MPVELTIGGEGSRLVTTLKTSVKTYPRPVSEVVRELSVNMSSELGVRVLQLTVLLNTDAVVNQGQANMLALLNWEQMIERQYLETVTMLNTLSG